MTTLQLLLTVRDILYQKYNQHYPIFDMDTLMQAMDEVHYKYADGKMFITLVIDLPPIKEV